MVNPTGYTALDMIGFTDQGAYSSSDNYVKNDLVHYSGNIWRCLIDDTSGIAPTEGVNWTLFIGEPTNLVERIIAPVETDPATSAWAVGRQIIFNDNLYEVITAITAGDALVTYEDDPTNANIKLADPVETQLLNVKGNLSNRNLLDNPWFTVNQRGASSYNSGYSIDRWRVVGSAATLTVNSDSIVFTTSAAYNNLMQPIEKGVLKDGQTYTLSLLLGDGTIFSKSFVFEDSSSYKNIYDSALGGFYGTYRTTTSYIEFIIMDSVGSSERSVTIKAAKLELGSISTLSMDTAPNYQQELAKCQRYFYRANMNIYCTYGVGMAGSATSIRFNFLTPVPMRVKPTISVGSVNSFGLSDGTNLITPTGFNLYGADDSNTFFLSALSSNLTAGTIYLLNMNATDHMDFSADL